MATFEESVCHSVFVCLIFMSVCCYLSVYFSLSVCLSLPLSQRNCQAKREHREEDRPRNQHVKDGRAKRGSLHNAAIRGGSRNAV